MQIADDLLPADGLGLNNAKITVPDLCQVEGLFKRCKNGGNILDMAFRTSYLSYNWLNIINLTFLTSYVPVEIIKMTLLTSFLLIDWLTF